MQSILHFLWNLVNELLLYRHERSGAIALSEKGSLALCLDILCGVKT